MQVKENTVSSEGTQRRYTGDPLVDIPCIETSEPSCLCRNPVVSVNMITYNHEAFIREAIEGVLMQKTDFEYELVIGEDTSQDKTLEICLEYQKKYPDKIRVLWWHENVTRMRIPAGANWERVQCRCRGEFVAYCEGDDYWTDDTKLQRQVDVLRRNPGLSMCCHQFHVLKDGAYSTWNEKRLALLMRQKGNETGFEFDKNDFYNPGIFTQTAAVMTRKSFFDFDFFRSIRKRCDITMFYAMLKEHNGYFINRTMSVYRISQGGLWQGMDERRKAEWHLGIATALMEADRCEVTERIHAAAVKRLKMTKFPYAQMHEMYVWVRVALSKIKRMLLGKRN